MKNRRFMLLAGMVLTTIAFVQATWGGDAVLINDGAPYTLSKVVDLNLVRPSEDYVRMSFSANSVKWSSWEGFAETKSYKLSSGDGLKCISVKFARETGEELAAGPACITLDTKKPTAKIKINGGVRVVQQALVTLDITASDSVGVTEMQISSDGKTWGQWETFAATRVYELPSPDGPKKVYARFRDAAGNISAPSVATVKLDTLSAVKFAVKIHEAPGGTISTNYSSVPYGKNLTVKAVPNTGYKCATLFVNNVPYTKSSVTLKKVTSDTDVSAIFVPADFAPPKSPTTRVAAAAAGINNGAVVSLSEIPRATSYTIYYTANAAATKKDEFSKVSSTGTYREIVPLENGVPYRFAATATVDGKETPFSAAAASSTTPAEIATAPLTGVELTVYDLVEGASLKWIPVDGATSYTVYWDFAEKEGPAQFSSGPISATSYVIKPLMPTLLGYKVSVVPANEIGSGPSSWSTVYPHFDYSVENDIYETKKEHYFEVFPSTKMIEYTYDPFNYTQTPVCLGGCFIWGSICWSSSPFTEPKPGVECSASKWGGGAITTYGGQPLDPDKTYYLKFIAYDPLGRQYNYPSVAATPSYVRNSNGVEKCVAPKDLVTTLLETIKHDDGSQSYKMRFDYSVPEGRMAPEGCLYSVIAYSAVDPATSERTWENEKLAPGKVLQVGEEFSVGGGLYDPRMVNAGVDAYAGDPSYVDQRPTIRKAGVDYFPLDDQMKKVWSNTPTPVSTVIKDGTITEKFADGEVHVTSYSRDAKGVYESSQKQTFYQNGDLNEFTTTLTPPRPMFVEPSSFEGLGKEKPFPIVSSTTFKTTFQDGQVNETTQSTTQTLTVTLLATGEEVTVPAGTFADCVKMRHFYKNEKYFDSDSTIWLAPNVGPVKMSITYLPHDGSQPQYVNNELVSFTPAPQK